MSSYDDEHGQWLNDIRPADMRRIVDAVYRVHQLISLITDLDSLLERIIEESKSVADAEASSLLLFDERSEELYFHVALGERGDQAALKSSIRLKLNQGIAGVAAAARESVNVADVTQDPRFFRAADVTSHFETRSLLAVPLLDRDVLIGVLEVVNKRGSSAFTEADMKVVGMFSRLAASAISNARLVENLVRAERLAAIGQAVAGLSHHTKNIITGMSGSVDLIDEGLARDNKEVLGKSWPILKRCINRITNFVEDMLAYSKPREPRYELCDVKSMLDEVTSSFWAMLTNRSIQLDVDSDGVREPVYCDPAGIYRCLLNLMTNAAEAAPKKGGVIRLIAATDGDGAFHLDIIDNGHGVPSELRDRIFEPFFSTKGAQGTGIGLAVTHKIVNEHRGSIEIEDSDIGGAAFRVTLPPAPAYVKETRQSPLELHRD